MRLTSPNFSDGEPIPAVHAFAVPDPAEHIRYSDNRNPALRWDDVPDGTRSFALLVIDPDVPSVGDDVNQEGRTVPADLPRTEFSHWVVVDIPADMRELEEGAYSDGGVVERGKPGRSNGLREGVNSYTGWFEGDPEMEGVYKGYDGMCPPWNDTIIHHYGFTLYALDTEKTSVGTDFNADEVRQAIQGHILAEATLVGTYSLNPHVG